MRAERQRRLNPSGAGDRNGNLIEEDDHWEDGGEEEDVESEVGFDFSENDLLDSDYAIEYNHIEENEGYDEEGIKFVESGDDSERSGRRRKRWDDEDDALGVGMRPSRHSTDRRRRSSSIAMPPAGREKKDGSMMKSVGSAAGRSAKALVHALQPKSVGLGEILDTWKIEQVRFMQQALGVSTSCLAALSRGSIVHISSSRTYFPTLGIMSELWVVVDEVGVGTPPYGRTAFVRQENLEHHGHRVHLLVD